MKYFYFVFSVLLIFSLNLFAGTDVKTKTVSSVQKTTAKRNIASKDICVNETGDAQFPTAVESYCCLHEGGKVNDNASGHPPIALCNGGKYDGNYVSAGDDSCLVDTEDPQFPVTVKPSCCLRHKGKVNKNKTGHPPIPLCNGGKYDGYYVGSDK
jgi:hypothetical protein